MWGNMSRVAPKAAAPIKKTGLIRSSEARPELVYERGCGPGEENLGLPRIDWQAVVANRTNRQQKAKPELVGSAPDDDILPDPTQTWEATRDEDRKRLGL